MTLREGIYAILRIARRELRRLVATPVYFFCMVVAPVGCLFFFTTLMRSGLPTDLPVAVVDLDNTPTSRRLVRQLDAFEQTAVRMQCASFDEARADLADLVRRGLAERSGERRWVTYRLPSRL